MLRPGSWWQSLPCHPSWGGFGRSPVSAVASATLGFSVRNLGGLLRGKPEAHLFVGVQCRRGDERLFQASPTAVTHIVMRDYDVIQVGEVISPCISAEGAEGQLNRLVPQVILQPPQAHGSVEFSK